MGGDILMVPVPSVGPRVGSWPVCTSFGGVTEWKFVGIGLGWTAGID